MACRLLLWFDSFVSPFVSLFARSLYFSMKFCAHKKHKTLFARSLYFSMHSPLVCLMKKEYILYDNIDNIKEIRGEKHEL